MTVKVPTVKECMADWWVTLRADMNIIEAADLLFSKHSAGAPVLDADGHLVGILTEKDCLRLLSNTTYMTSKFAALAGGTVADSIRELVSTYPDVKNHLLDKEGNLRSYVNVFVGDENIRSLDREATEVGEQTVISIVPAIAGGIR